MIRLIDLKKLHAPIQHELDEAIRRVAASGWYIGGDEVDRFEESFAKYCDVDYCIGCASGTDALELILRGMDIGPGDEVIVPALTWVSNAEAVIAIGAKPVFVDVDSSYNIDPSSIAERITGKTRAIMAVHLYGQPCRMDELNSLAATHGLKIIEDCAQAHGARYKDLMVGGLGDAAAFSFYPTKNLGALGDAGSITTNDKELAERVRLLTNHGQVARDVHVLAGRTSRLDPIQAAVLCVKLNMLDEWNRKRRENAKFYFDTLSELDYQLPHELITSFHVYHQFVIASENRDSLKNYFEACGIETAIHYPQALSTLSFFDNTHRCSLSEKFASSVLSIPMHPALSKSELEMIMESLLNRPDS